MAHTRMRQRYASEIEQLYKQSAKKLKAFRITVTKQVTPKSIEVKAVINAPRHRMQDISNKLKSIEKRFKYQLHNFIVFPHLTRVEKKEIETGTKRMFDKKGYVAYVTPEQTEAFEKAYGKRRGTGYADEITESMLHPEYYGTG